MRSDWIRVFGKIIEPELLGTEEESDLLKWVYWYYDKYKEIPEEPVVRYQFAKSSILDDIYGCDLDNAAFILDELYEWILLQRTKVAFAKGISLVGEGKRIEGIQQVIEARDFEVAAIDVGTDLSDHRLFDDNVLIHYPTGWSAVDEALEGGVTAGEYWLFQAPPGHGKSCALLNIAVSWASCGLHVLHVSAEMDVAHVMKRYKTRLVEKPYDKGEYYKQLIDNKLANLRGSIVINDKARRVSEVVGILDAAITKGKPFTALIVDYPDLFLPESKREQKRFELADISRDFRRIALDYHMPVFGATQARKEASGRQYMGLADIAESYEKGAIADGVISMAQTEDEERAKTGRLIISKSRNTESGKTTTVLLDFACQMIRCME